MVINVIGKKLIHYETTCTDKSYLAILEFDHSEVRYVNNSVTPHPTETYYEISCPHRAQILKFDDFKKAEKENA
jgi:hypothetical protein